MPFQRLQHLPWTRAPIIDLGEDPVGSSRLKRQ